jgi:hypothetical protein
MREKRGRKRVDEDERKEGRVKKRRGRNRVQV